MAESINLIAFGTFGSPNGFKQTFFVGDNTLARFVKSFDLNTNAIKLFPNSKVYAIRKDSLNGVNSIAYGLYTYAREQNSDRSGTFIGSSILYTDKVAGEDLTITQLNEFHEQLVYANVSNDTIVVDHSDKFSVVKPKDFDKIKFNLREIKALSFTQNSGKILLVYATVNPDNLGLFLEKSIDLLNVYEVIYFTESHEVAEFSKQKGIFKVIQNTADQNGFDDEIKALAEARARKREKSISEFEGEIQLLDEEKKKTLQDFTNQIEQCEKKHSENERAIKLSKDDLNKIRQFYDDFIGKTKELISQIKQSNSKLDEVRQVHNSNKRLFNNGISELKKPIYVTTIPRPKPNGSLSVESTVLSAGHKIPYSGEGGDVKSNINIYKLVAFVLLILLLATWGYLFILKPKVEIESNKSEGHVTSNREEPVKSEAEITKFTDLSPKPNGELNANDYKIVAKNISYNWKIDDVVKVVFDRNLKDISRNYSSQSDVYAKHLIALNQHCFDERDGLFYFTNDTLRHIPSYKN